VISPQSALIALLESGITGAAEAGAKAPPKSRAASPIVATDVRMRISVSEECENQNVSQ
jgi:hypothetical protein